VGFDILLIKGKTKQAERANLGKKKLGFIVNPVAGMGGRVGLKGSDGQEIIKRAIKLGSKPESPRRAIEALKEVISLKDSIELITYPYEMGENEAKECGFNPAVIGSVEKGNTTAKDTKNAARGMLKLKVDLLLFAGGDGTARDVYNAIGNNIPALGIPAGVKMHSAVYATTPANAGRLTAAYLAGKSSALRLREAEVMDIDEQAFRENRLSARLYGYLKVPYERGMTQDAKEGSIAGDEAAMSAIADDVISNMKGDYLYIIGPGTTTQAIMDKLGLKNTLLGVDAVYQRKLVGSDLNESQLLQLIEGKKAKIVVTAIGRQGYIFGRGNQQISAEVIKRVGKENIVVVATPNKILSLQGNPLLVDTDKAAINKILSGYMQVITGFGERLVLKVAS